MLIHTTRKQHSCEDNTIRRQFTPAESTRVWITPTWGLLPGVFYGYKHRGQPGHTGQTHGSYKLPQNRTDSPKHAHHARARATTKSHTTRRILGGEGT